MKCEHCGNVINEIKKDPWCMYQVKDGAVVSKMFHPDQIPKGWHDSPRAAKAAKTNKPKKATNIGLTVPHGDSPRINQ